MLKYFWRFLQHNFFHTEDDFGNSKLEISTATEKVSIEDFIERELNDLKSKLKQILYVNVHIEDLASWFSARQKWFKSLLVL